MFLGNEGLGKKDDDHRPTKIPGIRPPWRAAKTSRSKILKRLAIAFALGIFVYLFVRNLPTDVPIRDRRRPIYRPQTETDKLLAPGPMPKLTPDSMPKLAPDSMPKLTPDPKPQSPMPPPPDPPQPPPPPPSDPTSSQTAYNGPLLFQKLRPSLEAIYTTGGGSAVNKNILFAAASLKSAALLLPMACRMGDELRNYVHFALIGGSEIGVEDLRAVNGIDESCQIIFHGMAHSLYSHGGLPLTTARCPPGFCCNISYGASKAEFCPCFM